MPFIKRIALGFAACLLAGALYLVTADSPRQAEAQLVEGGASAYAFPPLITSGAPIEDLDAAALYLDLTQRVYDISNDSARAASFGVIQLKEVRDKNNESQKLVSELQAIITSTKNLAVKNTARMQLAETYRQLGRDEEAVTLYKDLVKNAP